MDDSASRVAAFRRGLADGGYVEGRNVAIEYRWADGDYGRLNALANELILRRVSVIATVGGTPPALVAKAATGTIPIIFALGGDPVRLGLVAALNRPGGNITGVTVMSEELGPKLLELLHELAPSDLDASLLINSTNPLYANEAERMKEAARNLGLKLNVLGAHDDQELEQDFVSLSKARTGGLVIAADPFFISRMKQLAVLAARYAIPTISQSREFAVAGGLMSYGGSIADAFRLAGAQTSLLLRGEKPADLPVQQATKIDLILNMKTAKVLRLSFPQTLLGRADELIE